jgi:hypothetical protein
LWGSRSRNGLLSSPRYFPSSISDAAFASDTRHSYPGVPARDRANSPNSPSFYGRELWEYTAAGRLSAVAGRSDTILNESLLRTHTRMNVIEWQCNNKISCCCCFHSLLKLWILCQHSNGMVWITAAFQLDPVYHGRVYALCF